MGIEETVAMLRAEHNKSLILNPTENIPWKVEMDTAFLSGLYLPEEERDEKSKVIFAGREAVNTARKSLYHAWQQFFGTTKLSMKFNSGLDAHIILFMSIAEIGDTVLLLPEVAGGHFATQHILERLGLCVINIPVLIEERRVDSTAALKTIDQMKPKFLFIDRSEGLNYEDFSWLKQCTNLCKIYDASQYLTHIIANHYENPFQMGFDVIVSTMHKNYPGFQKAAVFVPENSLYWEKIDHGLRTYISSIHPKDIFDTLLATPAIEDIRTYSALVLENARTLEAALKSHHIPVVERNGDSPDTQHIWIQATSSAQAYAYFRNLEKLHFLTNYRMLPYHLGHGLRLGTAAATRQGMTCAHTAQIAEIMANIWFDEAVTENLQNRAKDIIANIQSSKVEV